MDRETRIKEIKRIIGSKAVDEVTKQVDLDEIRLLELFRRLPGHRKSIVLNTAREQISRDKTRAKRRSSVL